MVLAMNTFKHGFKYYQFFKLFCIRFAVSICNSFSCLWPHSLNTILFLEKDFVFVCFGGPSVFRVKEHMTGNNQFISLLFGFPDSITSRTMPPATQTQNTSRSFMFKEREKVKRTTNVSTFQTLFTLLCWLNWSGLDFCVQTLKTQFTFRLLCSHTYFISEFSILWFLIWKR